MNPRAMATGRSRESPSISDMALDAVGHALRSPGSIPMTHRRRAALAVQCFILDLLAYPFRSSRSEEHTSELQSLMRISYDVFCLNNNKRSVITILISI